MTFSATSAETPFTALWAASLYVRWDARLFSLISPTVRPDSVSVRAIETDALANSHPGFLRSTGETFTKPLISIFASSPKPPPD